MAVSVKIILAVVAVIILAVGGGTLYMTRGLGQGSKLAVAGIRPENVSDGSYTGSYKAGRWTNKLSVVVKDHKITDIKLIKDVIFSIPELSGKVFNQVMEKQSTDIDIISGATVTTKAYLKSIENALNK